ncbi:MAG: PocR ligand-binding domain-containing protein [Acidobacteriota bacterium]
MNDAQHLSDVGEEELINLLDISAIKPLMDDFQRLTNAVFAILDLKGNVLLSIGWQDICTKFHRVHPVTSCNCTESDLSLARSVKAGEYVGYRCQNGLWDVVTPLIIGGKHVGNIYTGQFFYDDEPVDEAEFEARAERYGFDKGRYIDALRRVPRISREENKTLMDFLTKFASLISRMSYSNIQLAKSLVQEKEAREKLRASEAHFRLLADQNPIPLAICSEQGVIVYVNQRFTATFGYTSEDIPTSDEWFQRAYPDEAYRQESARLWYEAVEEAKRKSGDIGRHEYRVTCKDGTARIVEIFGSFIGSKIFVILNDLTERKEADDARRNLESQLIRSQRMEGIGTLASGIAHDFNNILNIIQGNAGLLEEKPDAAEKVRQRAAAILKASDRGAQLVKQLLTFARKSDAEFRPLDINDVVLEISKLIEETFPKTIRIHLALDSALPDISADANQIHQVLLNLSVNARDAMPSGGDFRIATRLVPRNGLAARYPAANAPQYIEVRVSDTGLGMDEETRRKIFDPFFTTKEIGKGTGLGLAVVAGIIERHNGMIDVSSRKGEGTEFLIHLPVYEGMPEARGTQSAPRLEAIAGGSETILLIEDEEQLREMTVAFLRSKGYSIIDAENGEEGVELYRRHAGAISIILSDRGLPKISGEDVYRRIRQDGADVPFLLLTGFIEPEMKTGLLAEGIRCILQKPVRPSEILLKIREILDGR